MNIGVPDPSIPATVEGESRAISRSVGAVARGSCRWLGDKTGFNRPTLGLQPTDNLVGNTTAYGARLNTLPVRLQLSVQLAWQCDVVILSHLRLPESWL